jgi:acyl-coenzyme A thioesterase 9
MRYLSTNEKDTSTAKISIQGQFKNPIVAKLWAMRQEMKEKERMGMEQITITPATTSKTPSQSATAISYPFSTDEFLHESYRNPWGEMRFGRILEDLDALAGNIAFQHVQGTPLLVTAAVDRITVRRTTQMDHDQHLSGKVTWVGTSSMEIRMQIADDVGEWMEAYFTFVTLDPSTKKPVSTPSLAPETTEERAHFELGARKAQAKKRARKNKHKLMDDETADALLKQAGPLINMPSLADPHSILMGSTKMQNAMIAQSQMKNLHDRIFGGFLMRRAFELAYANCYIFGGAKPIFREVDDISFDSPVDVGDLMVFNSRVLYTLPESDRNGHPLVMMEVEAWVTEPEKADARVSNVFYFTFALPEGTPCRKVLPSNIDEARRMSRRMAADVEQASLRA